MNKLLIELKDLKPYIKKKVDDRLKEFERIRRKGNKEWFSELCFCLLTSNSKAKTALSIQKDLGFRGFFELSEQKLAQKIQKHGHRFHNTKSKYIVEARKVWRIKEILGPCLKENQIKAREWLVKNVKGLGCKEASHFLRNTGHLNMAILDRHILRIMLEHNLIEKIPKTLNMINYLKLEKKLEKLTKALNMTQGELDYYMWYLKTHEVLK